MQHVTRLLVGGLFQLLTRAAVVLLRKGFSGHTHPQDAGGSLPSVTIGKLRIYEPMTVFTDLLLVLSALFFARRLFQNAARQNSKTRRAWAWGFMGSASAALAGGVFHGLGPAAPVWVRATLWKLTMFSTGFVSLCMLLGTVYAFARRQGRSFWLALTWFKSLVYLAFVVRKNDFRYVVYDYGGAMLAILLVQLAHLRTHPGAVDIARGIGISFLAALIQQVGINLHTHFNKNDLYHVIQGLGFWYFFRGAQRLDDQ